MAAPITKLRIGLQPDTPEEHTRLLINVNTEAAQTSLQITTDLKVRANPATAKIYYYNFDGSELLYTETIEPGGNGSWDGEPGRASTAQYEYIFNGWSTEPDQTDPTADATAGVYSSRRVYAAYARRDISGFVRLNHVRSFATKNHAKTWDGILMYSFDAIIWTPWNGESIATENGTVFLKGVGNTIITGIGTNFGFSLTADDIGGIEVDGNIEFLLDSPLTLSGEHPNMGRGAFWELFRGCTALIKAPELPATELASNCYSGMFYGCRALTTPPELPATELASNCYSDMFYGCTALTKAPELPATELEANCYQRMFNNCSALITPPKLPATTLAAYCYENMFYGCTALTKAPELPATTLEVYCYSGMFRGCRALTTPPELPATRLILRCYQIMFHGCTGIKLSTEQTDVYMYEYKIPSNGTGVDGQEALANMFYGTGGTFTGTPEINTTYYLAPPASA